MQLLKRDPWHQQRSIRTGWIGILILLLLAGGYGAWDQHVSGLEPGSQPALRLEGQPVAWREPVQDDGSNRRDSIIPAERSVPDGPTELSESGPTSPPPTATAWTSRNIYRLAILVVGVAIVLTGIIALNLNAFLALIVAALVVSLMGEATGQMDWASKVARVASEFGNSAGNVGLVIALAAVIGQSLMASGAAERIVTAFMSLLGEKRTPLALCGSGYVLGIPVFFDTVFYLLVPLARSMYLRTRSRYLAGLLAIAAGGAITHTLVPPTPGPMLVASNLGVNLGTMMLVGAMVAIVSAVAGLLFASLADRWIKIPVRWLEDPNTDEEAQHAHAERQLPSLPIALIPLALPVLLIAGSTVIGTMADAEQRARFAGDRPEEFLPLAERLITEPSLSESDLSGESIDQQSVLTANRVLEHIRNQPEIQVPEVQAALQSVAKGDNDTDSQQRVAGALNQLLDSRTFFTSEAFLGVRLSPAAEKLARNDLQRMPMAQLQRLNRLLLEDSLPGLVPPHQWSSPMRQLADATQVVGNPGLALLLAAIAALLIEKRQRSVSWKILGGEIEKALASAGVIILITAAGGAFGAMLKQAYVGDAIQEVFSQYSQSGLGLLVLAFLIASVLKFAQGSSTVAMITASGMLASVATPEQLGCHPVYMATAIGGGSLFGSWMNDSGFWIFTKMGYLTSVEGLKTWTPCLAILGATAGATTVLLAWLMPLV